MEHQSICKGDPDVNMYQNAHCLKYCILEIHYLIQICDPRH